MTWDIEIMKTDLGDGWTMISWMDAQGNNEFLECAMNDVNVGIPRIFLYSF